MIEKHQRKSYWGDSIILRGSIVPFHHSIVLHEIETVQIAL